MSGTYAVAAVLVTAAGTWCHRRTEGRWTVLDTTVAFGPTGQGVTSTVLHDLTGPVGHAQQILILRPLPATG